MRLRPVPDELSYTHRAQRTDSDGSFRQPGQPELDGKHGLALHGELQRLPQHDIRVHTLEQQPDCEQYICHYFLGHNGYAVNHLLLLGGGC